jgi:hypothetical protein
MSDAILESKMLMGDGSVAAPAWLTYEWRIDKGEDELPSASADSVRDVVAEKISRRVEIGKRRQHSPFLLGTFVGGAVLTIGAVVGLLASPLYGSSDTVIVLLAAAGLGTAVLSLVLRRAEKTNRL